VPPPSPAPQKKNLIKIYLMGGRFLSLSFIPFSLSLGRQATPTQQQQQQQRHGLETQPVDAPLSQLLLLLLLLVFVVVVFFFFLFPAAQQQQITPATAAAAAAAAPRLSIRSRERPRAG
jgi:hypothetical protein